MKSNTQKRKECLHLSQSVKKAVGRESVFTTAVPISGESTKLCRKKKKKKKSIVRQNNKFCCASFEWFWWIC